jgi:antitoxin (DNA-binding transcriptional repressor) of toxin-antitoxin stability system
MRREPRTADEAAPGPPIDQAVCSTACYTIVMARDLTQRQLRNESGEIMRGLDQGESFVVTRNGVPVGELTPLRRHRFVSADTAIAMFRGAPSVDLTRLRADLDSVASQDLGPRA